MGGDGDPLDVVEIGSAELEMGSITAVKPLGALAMIDDGELDWKLLAINPADPLAEKLNDISDVEKLPGVVTGIREWFRWYKTPDGKPLNEFGYDEASFQRRSPWRSLPTSTRSGRISTRARRRRGRCGPASRRRLFSVWIYA